MASVSYVSYDKPFDSVIANMKHLEQRACRGRFLAPVLGLLFFAFPVGLLVLVLKDPHVPLFVFGIVFALFALAVGLEWYFIHFVQRYRLARAALHAWSQTHGFAEQGHALVGAVENRRCTVTLLFRYRARNDFVLEGCAWILQPNVYSTCGVHVVQKFDSLQQVQQDLESGFQAMLGRYCH
jgi:hypothetical protein